ncbi:ATPase [Nostoc minutum NIES-26]|uniref:ATPase n=1 Tax=Nostoc minutum NIES-26 TaxID=1844469 RepID=A0A367QKR3_9NOSO|nr:ATPase [Nostoc minutum NIES-26]
MPLPENENQRLELLYQYQILNTPPEETFDDLTQLAADICETPIALISLVDAEREWFKSKVGLTALEVPRNNSFSSYTILQNDILIIPDTLKDERFAENPLVRSAPYFRFYAGVPLIIASGFALGSLSIIDFVPRNLTLKEQAILQKIARQVIRYLELHRQQKNDANQININFLFINHPHPMWIYNQNNLQFLEVNEAAIAQYGYSREEFLQMRICDIRPLEDVPILLEYLAKNQAESHFSGRWQHRCKNGQIIDVELLTHAIYYAGYDARLVVITDTTENKQIKRTLRESEARFRAVTETIPVPLVISRVSDGLILYANIEFIQTFRFAPDDFVSCLVSNLYHDAKEFKALLEALAHQGSLQNYELPLKRADGTSFWAIASLQYLTFNGEWAILAVLSDITERKNIEVKLQEQNEFLQCIFARIPLMIALIDTEGKLQWVNQEWEDVLGWQIKDFQNSDLLSALYPDPEYRQYVINFIQSAQRSWGDFRTQRRDGRMLDTSWTNVNLPNGQIIGIGQDITERKQTEGTLKAQAEREQLMRAVTQRIRQSLNLQNILNAIVKEVRDLLEVDRVVVYQFAPDMSGTVVAESVESGWTVSLGQKIEDTCFQTGGGVEYHQGRKQAVANIYKAGLSDCHLQLLEQFEVKANLVVPILLEVGGEKSGFLWGLLVAHQCSRPREWEENQLDFLDQLTVQIAIAIQQSSIFQQAQNELTERQKAEINLRNALAEKEVLLKEIHHRVKNNLQIVSSLLQLQSQTLKDPEVIRVFRDSQNRIDSISLIHKNLYTSPNIGQLDVDEYIENLATSLLISYQIVPGQISLETHIDSVSLNVDQAIACGLIVNELISNALKHAFPQQQPGKIIIALRNVGNNIEMIIQDNGIGLPHDLDWNNTDSLGLSLVFDLVTAQLEGSITVESQQGTVFKIQFPKLDLQQPISDGSSENFSR